MIRPGSVSTLLLAHPSARICVLAVLAPLGFVAASLIASPGLGDLSTLSSVFEAALVVLASIFGLVMASLVLASVLLPRSTAIPISPYNPGPFGSAPLDMDLCPALRAVHVSVSGPCSSLALSALWSSCYSHGRAPAIFVSTLGSAPEPSALVDSLRASGWSDADILAMTFSHELAHALLDDGRTAPLEWADFEETPFEESVCDAFAILRIFAGRPDGELRDRAIGLAAARKLYPGLSHATWPTLKLLAETPSAELPRTLERALELALRLAALDPASGRDGRLAPEPC